MYGALDLGYGGLRIQGICSSLVVYEVAGLNVLQWS